MALSHLPASLGSVFVALGHWLDKRSAARVPALLLGMLLASGRRTVTSWVRAGELSQDWRQSYVTVCAIGRAAEGTALSVQSLVRPLLGPKRLPVGIDDTPTQRYGPHV